MWGRLPQDYTLRREYHTRTAKKTNFGEVFAIFCNSATDPAPLFVAAIASHLIATWLFENRTLAIRALANARIYIVKQEACLARNFAGCFVIRVSALETSLKATCADSSTLTDATWASHSALTAWSCAPLEFVWFSYSDILLNHVVLLLNFCWAKLLYFIDRVLFLASLLHAR